MDDGVRRYAYAIGATVVTTVWWTLWFTTGTSSALVVAVAIQVTGAVLIARLTSPHRTALALALGMAVPALGPLAALAATVAGRAGRELLHDPHERSRRLDGREVVRSLSGGLPPLEAVLSSDPDTRRAALNSLSRRATAGDLEVLRFARARCAGEIGIEVALAFDEASQGFEKRVAQARAAVDDDRSYVPAATAFRILVAGIQSGIVDRPVIARLAAEARKYYEIAVAADRARARELLVLRAQLELADRRPMIALDLLGPSIVLGVTPGELTTVYQQAAYSARRFDLAFGLSPGAQALAS